MTRSVGADDLVAGRQEHCFHQQYQRTQQFLDGAVGRRLADATHGQRSAPDLAGMVARWQMDCLHLDYDGDEQWDIFFVSPNTGQVVNITNTREIAEESPTWSPDGRYLAYMVKPKTSSVFEIDIFDTLMRETKHLTTGTPNDRMNVWPIWSTDGKWIAYTQHRPRALIPISSSPKSRPARARC